MNYNKKQLDAINSDKPKVVVIAPAGSGKTHSLVGAIKKYHEDNPFDKIVAITFTKKAALELQSRSFGTNANCSTIHSWSLKELNKLGTKHKFKVSILQD
jgi:superfamily I DNA/RNA helicase